MTNTLPNTNYFRLMNMMNNSAILSAKTMPVTMQCAIPIHYPPPFITTQNPPFQLCNATQPTFVLFAFLKLKIFTLPHKPPYPIPQNPIHAIKCKNKFHILTPSYL